MCSRFVGSLSIGLALGHQTQGSKCTLKFHSLWMDWGGKLLDEGAGPIVGGTFGRRVVGKLALLGELAGLLEPGQPALRVIASEVMQHFR